MSEPTPDRAELELRMALLAAFEQATKEELDRLKKLWRQSHHVGDSARPPIPDGTERPAAAATITYKYGPSSIVVNDPEAFQAWVESNAPEWIEVVEQVRPEFVKRFANANGILVGPNGELDVPGIVLRPSPATVQVRPDKDNRGHLFAAMADVSMRELLGGSGLVGEGSMTDD